MDQTIEIDALGLVCPLPVLRLRKRLNGLPPGSIVRLLADDPVAQVDIPHFCTQEGHTFLGMSTIEDTRPTPRGVAQAYLVQRKAD